MANRKLVQFGNGGTTLYTFPDYQESIQDNFNALVPNTARLPGLSGGFDQYGQDPAPQEIGRVTATFYLWATPDNMEDYRDAVKKMSWWGVQRLYLRPAKTGADLRWCYARVNNINMSDVSGGNSDYIQKVVIDFQVSDPHWYSQAGSPPVWGDGVVKWGDTAFRWGGTGTAISYSGLSSTNSITVGGNAPTRPRLLLQANSFGGTSPLVIQHAVSGVVDHQITYSAALAPFATIEIDCRSMTFYVNGAESYSSAWGYTTSEIFQLVPGDQSIIIRTPGLLQGGTGTVSYYEAYT